MFRRLAARNRIFKGYRSQYQFFREHKVRPLDFQNQVENLDKSQLVAGTFLLVADEFVKSQLTA